MTYNVPAEPVPAVQVPAEPATAEPGPAEQILRCSHTEGER